jgi:DNA-binding GntR family transcriptional regulator
MPAPAAADTAPSATGGRPPLARRALYEEVAEQLRQRIFARELEPGEWIDELKIAAELGISRTPLREALKVLAVEGVVVMKPRRGAYVAETSRDDVAQVYHLLALLESDAAAAAARVATDAQIDELQALHDRLERQVKSRDAFFAANEAFHLKLLEVAGNRWCRQIVADLRKIMKINRHHSLFKRGRLEDSLAEHREIMTALRARDGKRVARLMKSHFDNGLEASV